ncbi:acetyltransferase [Clostridia bacterium]|nr:acetyltransferase [Clostridia bacterium]
MTIRKMTAADLEEAARIYAEARDYMRESGNPNQWYDYYPPREKTERDVEDGTGYVCVENGEIAAVFYFNIGRDPTYEKIDGAWLNDEPYGVIHRIARRRGARGAAAFCVGWCFEQCGNIKIDTHRDNAPMRGLLERLGFEYCGIIWLEDGAERMAFQRGGSL